MQILPLRYAQGQDDSGLGQLIARRMRDLGNIVADSSLTVSRITLMSEWAVTRSARHIPLALSS